MTRLRDAFFALTLGALLDGCAAPVPSSSSSTHWVACKKTSDCDGIANATACNAGYCADSSGSRVSQSVNVGKTCDPLAEEDAPVQLGQIMGIGRDPATGITYLGDFLHLQHTGNSNVDRTAPDPEVAYTATRVFVSEGGELLRHTWIGGTGPVTPDGHPAIGNEDAVYNSVTFDPLNRFDGELPDGGFAYLAFKLVGGVTTRMLLNAGPYDINSDAPPIRGTELVVEDPSVVSSFRLKDLPGIGYVDSVSDVDDGSVLVIAHHSFDSTEFVDHIYWGKADDVRERRGVQGPLAETGNYVFEADPASGGLITLHFDRHTDGTTGTLKGPGVNRTLTARIWQPASMEAVDTARNAVRGVTFTCL